MRNGHLMWTIMNAHHPINQLKAETILAMPRPLLQLG